MPIFKSKKKLEWPKTILSHHKPAWVFLNLKRNFPSLAQPTLNSRTARHNIENLGNNYTQYSKINKNQVLEQN